MSSTVFYVIAAIAAVWLFRSLTKPTLKLDMPYLEFDGDNSLVRYTTDTRSLMQRGYDQYIKHGKPFAMLNHVDYRMPLVILPLKYLEEVRSAPSSKLSFPVSLEKSTIINDIGGPKMTDEAIHVVKLDLNKQLTGLIPSLQEACIAAYPKVMPACPDWTPVPTYQFLLMLFSRITARVLVGPELCDNEEWLGVLLGFTNSAFKASHGVRAKYHPSMRWLAKYMDQDVKDVYKFRRRAAQILRPILEAREEDIARRAKGEEPNYDDSVQWLANLYKSKGNVLTLDKLAQDQFIINIASMHSSAATALSVLYDLMDRPESLAKITEEISRVQKEHGQWTRKSLGALRILDSFMKESQRVHALQQLTMQRMAVQPFTFKDGLHLPVGTQISLPSEMIALDPDFHQDPQAFDSERFLRKRDEIDPSRFHFASISDDMIPFGSGTHACPGRFLAQEVMKLMFIHLLTHYEFKYPKDGQTRPADTLRHHNIMPDVTSALLFKEIVV